ncbi:MAG: ABC transporter substrate-binding protein [Acidobacteriota bacterium]
MRENSPSLNAAPSERIRPAVGARTGRSLRIGMWFWLLLFILRPLSIDHPAHASDGNEDVLRLGMSTALTGPASVIGINMQAGVLMAIDEINRSGGIHGKKLRLLSVDDGYEPSRTAPNMHWLIEELHVLAVVGNVGTPTSIAAIPIANENKTPYIGAFTGAGGLRRNPPDRYVINYRASYAEETGAMVDALITHGGLAANEIAFFTQRDTYGDAGFTGGLDALRRHGLKDDSRVVHGRYERNTMAVENGLADIIMASPQPRAVIMVGAYAPCAAFIKLAKVHGLKAAFFNVSFVGIEPLSEALGPDSDGVIVTQVVPHFESDLPLMKDYRAAVEQAGSGLQPTFGSLEGYIVMRILLRAMASIQGEVSRESVVDALERLGDFDLGLGEPLRLSPEDHQACHRVWPTVIRKGKAIPFEWSELKGLLGSQTR